MPRAVFRRHPYAALAERPLVRPLIPASGAALVLLSSLPSFAQARASAEPIRLEWIRLEGAESCPARRAFERALSNKLGGSPFSHGAPRTLTIELSNEAGPFRAVLSLRDTRALPQRRDGSPRTPAGEPHQPSASAARAPEASVAEPSGVLTSRQELFSYSSRCDELFEATLLTVSLLLQPVVAPEGDDDPRLSEEAEPAEVDASPVDEDSNSSPEPYRPPEDVTSAGALPRAPEPWSRTAPQAELTLIFAIEQLPESGFGFGIRSDFPIGARWLFHLEGNWLPSRSTRITSGNDAAQLAVSMTTAWFGVTWIAHRSGPIEMLVDGSVGASFLHAVVTPAESFSSGYFPLATTRLGAGAAVHLNDQVVLRAMAVAILPLDRVELGLTSPGNRPLWTLPRLGGQVQLGLAVAFD